MKYTKLVLGLILVVGLSFVGCKDDNREITILGEDSASIQAITKLKEEYTDATNMPIRTIPLSFEESFEKSNFDFANHTGKYDIVMQYNFSLSSFVRNNYVYSLEELQQMAPEVKLDFESNLFQKDWKEVGFYYKDFKKPEKGIKKVGYPFASNSMILTYNKDMFNNLEYKKEYKIKYGKELTPPTNWKDYKNIAEFFTKPSKNLYGVCLQGASSWMYYEWACFAYGMNGGVMNKQYGWEGDENSKININSTENISASKFYIDLKPFNKGAFFDVDMNEQARLMKEGNVAMAIMWSDVIFPTMNKDGVFDKRFAYSVIPGEKSMLAGGAFFINKDSKRPKDAYKFLVWLFKEDNQIELIKNGLCSPLKSVYDDSRVAHIPYLKAVKSSLERGVYMTEAGPDADLISQKIVSNLARAWKNEITVEEALNKAQEEVLKDRVALFKTLK